MKFDGGGKFELGIVQIWMKARKKEKRDARKQMK